MLKNKNIYFTGKVLNVKELASDNAKSFRFSNHERKQLNLKGLPIRLEHEDNLEVGTITNSWNGNDNQHWVFGRIDKNTIPATFAKHALMKSGPNRQNKPYYTGLSLQHVHREYPNGKTEKKGIEVSLCTDPRRPNCNIIWTSNNNNKMVPKQETRNMPYKLVKQLASKNNIMSQVVPKENTQTENMEMETEVPNTQQAAPTGAELSEQVYSQFSELMEKEKAQQDKIQELEKQLAQHNETLEKEKQKKQEDDAAKGRALMSTFLEHVKELVGDQGDLQATVEPLIAQNPEGMGRVMEIVSKASKKFAENSLALKVAQTSLKDKELELKFQKLIQNNALVATNTQNNNTVTEILQAASSKKREAPAANNVQKAVKNVINPYSLQRDNNRRQTQPRMQQRRRGGMNTDLLKMYNQNRGDGLRAMGKLHKSLSERQQRSTIF